MVIKVNSFDNVVIWRWKNLMWVGIGTFFLSWLWRFLLNRKENGSGVEKTEIEKKNKFSLRETLSERKVKIPVLSVLAVLVLVFPFFVKFYQVGIMTSALMFVILGLGLNIVIGYGGLLHLGYAAFYAMGAYTYGLMYLYFGLPFWGALPLGAVTGALFGILIGVPVLRLRGDYLAIVTLAFGEISRLLLENMSGFTRGPEGIAQIPRPGFFVKLSLQGATTYLFYISIVLVIFTIFVIRRLEDSRIGRALEAMKEDDIAAQSMGIDLAKTKLITFALGAVWAGMVGVVLASKTTYINPGSFTLMESVMILVAVVLGGTGSIPGVILGAFLVTLIPEYFRALADYRMLMFGVALVVMSIFRPQGIIPRVRKRYLVGEEQS
jgi:branched-chain amino acid transport system permease protein